MILIAHRGLIDGPDQEKENNPKQIKLAWESGFNCEIDLRVTNKELWLGHDEPQYKIDYEFLISGPLWIHAKNLEALEFLSTKIELLYFWHENDKFTLTSNHRIWTYPGQPLTNKSVMVMPELQDPNFENLNTNCYAICSDYVNIIKEKLRK